MDRGIKMSSLECFNLVKLRNGHLYILMNDFLISFEKEVRKDYPVCKDDYEENGVHKNHECYDIMEIRGYDSNLIEALMFNLNANTQMLYRKDKTRIIYTVKENLDWSTLKYGDTISVEGSYFIVNNYTSVERGNILRAKVLGRTKNENDIDAIVFEFYKPLEDKYFVAYACETASSIKLLSEVE